MIIHTYAYVCLSIYQDVYVCLSGGVETFLY